MWWGSTPIKKIIRTDSPSWRTKITHTQLHSHILLHTHTYTTTAPSAAPARPSITTIPPSSPTPPPPPSPTTTLKNKQQPLSSTLLLGLPPQLPLLLFFLLTLMVATRGARGAATTSPAAMVTRVYNLANHITLQIGIGDLTQTTVGAIVNAANERMLGGGGVDGAIHRAAGPQLYDACKAVPEVSRGVRCPTGEARITKGFDLPASHVIHTVGPVYKNDYESAPLLQGAFRSSLDLANREGLASIAFPAISCGIFGYPVAKAATIAVETCVEFSEAAEGGGKEESKLKDIRFVLFSREIYTAWVRAAEELVPVGQHVAPVVAGEEGNVEGSEGEGEGEKGKGKGGGGAGGKKEQTCATTCKSGDVSV